MDKNDKFLKVEMTAYFPIANLNIKEIHDPNDEDQPRIFLDGKPILPDLYYYFHSEDGSEKVESLELDSMSTKETFITREKIWEEDPTHKIFDETLEKHTSESVKD